MSESNKNSELNLCTVNSDCLMHIYKFLNFIDHVNFAQTCKYLKGVGTQSAALKYKQFNIQLEWLSERIVSENEFVKGLTFIGCHIRKVVIRDGNQFVLNRIMERCKNLNALHLFNNIWPLKVPNFTTLTEISVSYFGDYYDIINNSDWELIFKNNQSLDTVRNYDCEPGFAKVCLLLPKLKNLLIEPFDHVVHNELEHFLQLTQLTTLSLSCGYDNCADALMRIAQCFKLKEFNLKVNLTEDILQVLTHFNSLITLGLSATNVIVDNDVVSNLQQTILPPKLELIKFKNINTSVDYLLSILNQKKMLKEIHLYDGSTFKCSNVCDVNVMELFQQCLTKIGRHLTIKLATKSGLRLPYCHYKGEKLTILSVGFVKFTETCRTDCYLDCSRSLANLPSE